MSEAGVGDLGSLAGEVGYELKRAQHALRLRMDEELRELDLTPPQYAAMRALSEEPGLSNAQLARRSFVTPQTMNRILARLMAGGLVERRAHAEHGRVLQSYLTGEGERLLRLCHWRVSKVEERMVAGVSERERQRLLEALRACVEALKGDESGPGHGEGRNPS